MDSNSTQLAAILTDTGTTLPASLALKMPTTHIDATAGKVDGVALVDTTTTNTDMRGTDGANTTAPDNTSIAAILVDTALLSILASYKHVLDPADGSIVIYDTDGTTPLYSGLAYSDADGLVLYDGTAAVHHTTRLT